VRILYAALDQTVPGRLGGSVHVAAVATGLAALGHDVHVLCRQGSDPARAARPWDLTPLGPPLGRPALRWARRGAVTRLARELRADVVIERYYNFGGEGVLAARALDIPAVLEVNAPIVDYPGSPKRRLDRLLLVEPMRRWRDRLCRLTSLFVTPSADILPAWIDRARVLEVEWGADVDTFRPDAAGPAPFARDRSRVACVFAGAFRAWHGAPSFAAALARLEAAGDRRFAGVFIGEGPERPAAEAAARGASAVTFTGALPHSALPASLAAADLGVAPFDPGRHGPLSLGFYWSPLKIFEYMASGLPVVAPALPRLSALIAHQREGWLYDPADPRGLERALAALADPAVRAPLGAAARARAVREYSWAAHCRALDARLRTLVSP
jgi:glycosyltransferase involved in cell wall biosynthesis